MRLLQRTIDGRYALTEFTDDTTPKYAVLSHTWGTDEEEVTFSDLQSEDMTKAGYKKLQFCADQAAKDGLRYFWVDTCAIDKTSSAELSEAINSMFRWYSRATRCYAYLSDVSTDGVKGVHQEWLPAFKGSRWFRRGWTLQELVAPSSVDFFSVEGEKLGTKHKLVDALHNITGISVRALQGVSLDQFTVEERMTWMNNRQTKRQEDMAYSLMEIFNVHMPAIYGEGRDSAMFRLQREIRERASKREPAELQHKAPESPHEAAQSYGGAVFNGAISGHYVIPGLQNTGGTTNFNFRGGA